jgi:hypothetical protein
MFGYYMSTNSWEPLFLYDTTLEEALRLHELYHLLPNVGDLLSGEVVKTELDSSCCLFQLVPVSFRIDDDDITPLGETDDA